MTDTTTTAAEPKAAPKGKAGVQIKAAKDDWAPPRTNPAGQQVDGEGWPIAPVARAMALAQAGKASDPGGVVTDEQIAAYDPKAAEADRVAVDQFHADQRAEAAAELEKAAAADAAQRPAQTL